MNTCTLSIKTTFTLCMVILCQYAYSQNVGIGTPTPAQKLHVAGAGQTIRVDGLSGAGTRDVYVNAFGDLTTIPGTPGTDWLTVGNAGTTAATNFIGTTDAIDFVVKTGGAAAVNERLRVLTAGQVVQNATTIQAGDVFSVYGNGYTAPVPISAIGNWAINGYVNSTTGAGVYGENASGIGVFGNAGLVGVYGATGGATGFGVQAYNANATGAAVIASGNTLGGLYLAIGGGGYFRGSRMGIMGFSTISSAASSGAAVEGVNNKVTIPLFVGGSGVVGIDSCLVGVGGVTGASYAAGGNGVYGQCTNTDGTGVFGFANSGVFQYGVWGVVTNAAGTGANSLAVIGDNQTGAGGSVGVLGVETVGGPAGKYGVFANGDMGASGTKPFMIDHPLDPANKMLRHFAMESPEILNMYRGNVILDLNGEAVVQLPDYFESINNTNYSYHLTSIGQQTNVFVKDEISNKQFTIGGGLSGAKVSWMVMAERNDPYLQQNPQKREVVMQKSAGMVGKYIMPQLYGQPDNQRNFGGKQFRLAQEQTAGTLPVSIQKPKSQQ